MSFFSEYFSWLKITGEKNMGKEIIGEVFGRLGSLGRNGIYDFGEKYRREADWQSAFPGKAVCE